MADLQDEDADKRAQENQPRSTPRKQRGESKGIGPGPSGQEQTDDQDNLHNNVSDIGDKGRGGAP